METKTDETTSAPFRWDLASGEVARRAGRGLRSRLPARFRESLLGAAVDVLRAAGDSDLVFVGRSPESIHDFLAGALARTGLASRLRILQLSLRCDVDFLRLDEPDAWARLRRYLEAAGLGPRQLLARPRPVAFVDLVYSGETFGALARTLDLMADESGRWGRVRRRLRWVCLTSREERGRPAWDPSLSPWTRRFSRDQTRCVRIDARFWRYLGEQQRKMSQSYTEDVWAKETTRESLEGEHLEAVREARAVFRLGECWRRRLEAELDPRPSERCSPEAWVPRVVDELRASYAGKST